MDWHAAALALLTGHDGTPPPGRVPGDRRVGIAGRTPWLADTEDGRYVAWGSDTRILPFPTEGLLDGIGALAAGDDEAILAFASQHGVLGPGIDVDRETGYRRSPRREMLRGEPVEVWRSLATGVAALVSHTTHDAHGVPPEAALVVAALAWVRWPDPSRVPSVSDAGMLATAGLLSARYTIGHLAQVVMALSGVYRDPEDEDAVRVEISSLTPAPGEGRIDWLVSDLRPAIGIAFAQMAAEWPVPIYVCEECKGEFRLERDEKKPRSDRPYFCKDHKEIGSKKLRVERNRRYYQKTRKPRT